MEIVPNENRGCTTEIVVGVLFLVSYLIFMDFSISILNVILIILLCPLILTAIAFIAKMINYILDVFETIKIELNRKITPQNIPQSRNINQEYSSKIYLTSPDTLCEICGTLNYAKHLSNGICRSCAENLHGGVCSICGNPISLCDLEYRNGYCENCFNNMND